MADVLSALDETFLELEELEPGALMNIGAILVFDPLPEGGAPTLSELRASRLESLGQLPRYTQRLSTTRTGRFARLCWETGVDGAVASVAPIAARSLALTRQRPQMPTMS